LDLALLIDARDFGALGRVRSYRGSRANIDGGTRYLAAQDSSQGSTQDAQAHANAQVLMAQQVMAEQSKRMADFMFWQLILGVALLIGVGIAIYYARQIARAAVNVGPRVPVTPTQRTEGARLDQQRKIKP
jgi:hypothetical protein